MQQATITHDQLQAALDLAALEPTAAEAHGLVCGELCRRSRLGPGDDFAALLGVREQADGAQQAVLGLVDDLGRQSGESLDAGVRFDLLLPDDTAPVAERTAALADWAHGFTLALLRGDGVSLAQLEADSAEITRDLLKISEARPGEEAEDDERALAEIEEYIRVGVQLVFEELQPDAAPADDGSQY